MSAAYGIAEIVSISSTFTGGVPGDRMPGNPDRKVSGSLDYSDTVRDGLELFAGTGFSYTGHYLNGLSVDWSTFAGFVTFPGLDVHVIGQFPSGVDQYNDPGSGDYLLFDADRPQGRRMDRDAVRRQPVRQQKPGADQLPQRHRSRQQDLHAGDAAHRRTAGGATLLTENSGCAG